MVVAHVADDPYDIEDNRHHGAEAGIMDAKKHRSARQHNEYAPLGFHLVCEKRNDDSQDTDDLAKNLPGGHGNHSLRMQWYFAYSIPFFDLKVKRGRAGMLRAKQKNESNFFIRQTNRKTPKKFYKFQKSPLPAAYLMI